MSDQDVKQYEAHVHMGNYEHQNYVTADMASDAGLPEIEGDPIAGPTEEVWEDHTVVLADAYDTMKTRLQNIISGDAEKAADGEALIAQQAGEIERLRGRSQTANRLLLSWVDMCRAPYDPQPSSEFVQKCRLFLDDSLDKPTEKAQPEDMPNATTGV